MGADQAIVLVSGAGAQSPLDGQFRREDGCELEESKDKLEPSCIACGNVKWCNYFQKHCGSS